MLIFSKNFERFEYWVLKSFCFPFEVVVGLQLRSDIDIHPFFVVGIF